MPPTLTYFILFYQFYLDFIIAQFWCIYFARYFIFYLKIKFVIRGLILASHFHATSCYIYILWRDWKRRDVCSQFIQSCCGYTKFDKINAEIYIAMDKSIIINCVDRLVILFHFSLDKQVTNQIITSTIYSLVPSSRSICRVIFCAWLLRNTFLVLNV